MTVDCEGWTKGGVRLGTIIMPDTKPDAALTAYALAEPMADVIRLTVTMPERAWPKKAVVLTIA